MGHCVGHGDRSSGLEQDLKAPVACKQEGPRHARAPLCVSQCVSVLADTSAGVCCAKLEPPETLFIKS